MEAVYKCPMGTMPGNRQSLRIASAFITVGFKFFTAIVLLWALLMMRKIVSADVVGSALLTFGFGCVLSSYLINQIGISSRDSDQHRIATLLWTLVPYVPAVLLVAVFEEHENISLFERGILFLQILQSGILPAYNGVLAAYAGVHAYRFSKTIRISGHDAIAKVVLFSLCLGGSLLFLETVAALSDISHVPRAVFSLLFVLTVPFVTGLLLQLNQRMNPKLERL